MKIVVGLGNPGKQYVKTRHNIGFRVLDQIASQYKMTFIENLKFKAEIATGVYHDQDVVLVKPHTFMNRSGETVAALLHWYKASALDLLVVHDDLDIAFGSMRFREKGSSGGHNGLESMITSLGFDTFSRLKIGIGRPPEKIEPAAYVLMPFSRDEEKELAPMIEKAAARIEEFIRKR